MISPEYCQLMARYNHWMNERLFAVCAKIDDSERKRDRGAFFKSIHGTLAHILWGDSLWLSRFTGEAFDAPAWGQGWVDDFDELGRRRAGTDEAIAAWAAAVSADWLAGTLEYVSRIGNRQMRIPRAIAAAHIFNHATHHRGQLTTLLSQMGIDPGSTDLPFLPGVSP